MLATVLQWLVLALVTGVLVGLATSAFLLLLLTLLHRDAAMPLWTQMVLLPAGGLANGLLLYYGYRLNRTAFSDSEIVAVNEQDGHMPLKTQFVKPLTALITLWSGGSAGKQGPCAHIGAGVASSLGELLQLNPQIRKRLVACGVSAGFSSAFGTPIAGALYGVEMLAVGRIRHDFLFPGVVAGVTAFEVSRHLGVPYPDYHISFAGYFSELLFLKTIVIGILGGIAAWIFVEALQKIRLATTWLRERYAIWPPAMPLLGGIVIALLIIVIPTDYLGLSMPLMNRALAGDPMPWLGFLWKAVLVALTLGTGFYGGIVTPQLVIGAVAGNALAPLFGLKAAMGAAVGLCAVVASASNAPIAAVFMGIEYFGGESTLYFAGASIAAYLIIGHRSVYPEQHLAYTKTSWLRARPDTLIGLEKVQLSRGLLRWWSKHSGGGRHNRHDDHRH
jgi:H+/Cl- antiporter ClcA